ncbi:MAG: fatty acyl-AMP ligase, partial [Planctomycetota bacterium]
MRDRCRPGDRAVLAFPPGLDFISAFFGCLYAGVLPAPATYPKPRRGSSRLDGIAKDCLPQAFLTTAATLDSMALDGQSDAVRQGPWYAVDQWDDDPSDSVSPVSSASDDVAFLQYTSGSTSRARGVMVTHGNLLHNLEQIRCGFQLADNDQREVTSGVFWLPAYHDMGLIGGILTPLYVGGTSYLTAPTTFLRRPLSWLELISRTGAQISGAPNFAYAFCTEKITAEQRSHLDLSRWQIAFCGAEPINAAALAEFADAFSRSGFNAEAFYPSYGLAEATLMATGGEGPARPNTLRVCSEALTRHRVRALDAASPGGRELVSCGRPLGDQQVAIVQSQTGQTCDQDQIGEIWIRGRSVTKGYWNGDESTAGTFAARLPNGEGPFLKTGDLGFVYHGELFVTGRIK